MHSLFRFDIVWKGTQYALRALLTTILLVGCSTTTRDPSTISETEALTVLKQAELHARAGDVNAFCQVTIQSRDTCEHQLRTAGGFAAVPEEAPTVVQSYVVPDTTLEAGGIAQGGRMLVLEGKNGLGQPYRMEFLVFDQGNNQLVSLAAPYWFNFSVTQVGSDGWGLTPPSP